MQYWERHLPHWIPGNTPIFVTWRLAGTTPPLTRDRGWLAEDAEVHRAPGPRWLSDKRMAAIVQEAIVFGGRARYSLHAWVIMPNHVHVLFTPMEDISKSMQWLKWTTARRCNLILRRQGAFWQQESYDHWVRDEREFGKIVDYIECNPVAAGLVEQAEDWEWSSARRTGGLAAGQS